MPTNNEPLSLERILTTELKPLEQVAESEATNKKYLERFAFDPSISIADEIELKRQEEIEQIKLKAQKQKATDNFIHKSESNARIGANDVDSLNGIAQSLDALNGVKNLSIDSMQSNLVNINAEKVGGVFKGIAKDLNQNSKLQQAANQNSAFNQIKEFDSKKKPESKIEPIKNNGNKYLNSVKRGSASIIQLASLLHDGGYEAFERGADLVTGWDVNGHVPYKTNKVFDAMAQLKEDKYKQSDSLSNVMTGAEIAGKEAEKNGQNATIASLQHLAKNGSLGDAGEILAEFIPSLYLGAGAGSAAERGASVLANKYVASSVGRSIVSNSVINPVRLAAIQTVVPKVVQGAVMSGVADFVGSVAPEIESQQKNGYSDSEAVSRALTRSLAQASVSAAGGSLLPIRVGGDLTTVLTQSAIQGLAGYGSGYVGAKSIGEDYSSTEGALNILFGAVTALPEVVMVGGVGISKSTIKAQLDDLVVDRAIADTMNKQEIQDTRSVYFGSTIRELLTRVKSSKTNQISPETIKEFVRDAQADGDDAPSAVYIDVDTFNQLGVEHNIDLDSIFELAPELSRDYERVNDINGLIRVPLDELLTAFSKIDNEQYLNAFSDSLRYHPEALTAGEARTEFAKTAEDMKSDVLEIQQQYAEQKKNIDDIASVADVIGADLANIEGGFSADYNNQAKSLVSAFYETLADKTGVSAMDLYQSMPLRVMSNAEQAADALRGDVDTFNQSANPQVELRKIYGYRDSHLAPDAEGGVSGSQITDAFPELTDRSFTKNYGDGFKYDAKTVKIIREMQKNPEGEIKVYRAVPDSLDVDSLNFGDWVGLTKDYADEHGKSRFDGKYKVIEQTVKASDLYTDGNSIHEWGYSPKSSEIHKARLLLSEQLKNLNSKLDQGLFSSRISKTDVLGDKAALKNNPALAKAFLDSKGVATEVIENQSNTSEAIALIAPELKDLEYNSDIKQNQDLLDRAFDALYLQDLRDEIDDPNASEFSKNRAFNKLIKFSEVDNDKKFNLIDNKISKVKNAKSDGIDEVKTRESALEKAKSFEGEYDQFIDNVLRDLGLDYYNQKFEGGVRGQIQFRKDKKGAVIILGKDADFSTFAHELGHHFLEMSMNFAMRPDAPEQLKNDMIKVMEWSKQGKGIDDWNNLTPEQKTEVHEKFAETFEQYMFSGKAPSNELRKVFSRFRSFMAAVYKNIEKFMGIQKRADLNPEIRDVMDRMLATQDAIEQVQRQRNLEFTIAQDQAMELGISPKEYLEMVDDHKSATEAAINELEQKTLKDLARYRTLRNKHVKAFSEQQKRVRQQIREKVAEEVAAMPVYQVLAYLKQPVEKVEKVKRDPNTVDPKIDTLLEAIAKMGGINSKEIESTWGTDLPESYKVNVGRVKKVARKDGLSIETVAERLAEDGYLSTDENGKLDVHEFENLFTDSLSGGKYYSRQADPELFMMGDDYGLAMKWAEEFPQSGKLNIEWLKSRYGEESEIYKAVATTGRYGLASKDGIDPDMIADQFGFQSADAMINELAASPPPKDLIEERANDLIQAQYSEFFDDQSMQMAIDEAIHNDIRSMMLARELTAITKLQGRQSEFNAAAKSLAQNIIDKSLITEIRPHLFSAAELRQAKAYDKALKAGNTLDAVRAKRQQLISFHAVKQAYEANAFVDKLFTLAKTVNGNDERLAKNRDFNLVAITRYVLDLYGITDNKSNFEEHIKNLKQYDPLSASQVADLLYTTDEDGNTEFRVPVKDYTEMTYLEFQTLNDVIRQLWHRSKESQKLKVNGENIDFSAAVDNLVSSMQTKPKKSRAGSFLGYTPRKSTDFNPQRAFQTLKRAEQLFTWLDGGKSNGFFHQYVFNPMQDALASYRLEQKKMMQEMVNIYSEFDVLSGKIDATELGGDKTTFESKHELLHAILHTGNESNKSRLTLGYGWAEKRGDGSIDYSKFDNFIQRMFDEGVVTKKDMDAIQKIWNMFDGYKEQAQKTHKNINGLYFKELPKSKVLTPFGEYEGGYIPADYNRLLSVEAEQRGKANDATTQDNGFFKAGASTGANFTKSRVESYRGDFMTLDLTQLPMHLDRELRYIHLEEQLKQTSKIFRNKDVMNTLETVSPFATDSIISDWLNAIANQRVSKQTEHSTMDKIVEKLKQNSGIVLMAGNIKNAVEAWTSIPQLTVAVPKRELAAVTAKYFVNTFSRESMTKQVRELSPFMDSRLDNVANEMRFKLENIVTNPSKLRKGSDFLKQNAYVVQQVFQVPLETIAWMSAFNDSQVKGMSEADAVHHADGVVRMYLNDMSPEGISKIERSNPLVRAMLMFYGWFNMVHNTWSMNSKLINENPELSKISKMGAHAGLYTMMIAMPAMLAKALTLSFNGELFDNEDAEDWSEDLVNITVKSQAEMIFGMMPFARDVINPIYRTTFDATIYSDRYSVSPIQSMAENLFKAGKSSIAIAENLVAEGENDIDKSKVSKEILQAATFATGVPFTIVQRPVTYATDVLIDEDQEPKNIADAVRGTLNGR